MARPGDTTHRIIKVTDASGSAVTGLTLASFTVTAYGRSYSASSWSSYTSSAAVTEIGSGLYALSFVLPSSGGWWRVFCIPTSSSHTAWSSSWEGEVETQDLDSTYASVVRTQATLATSAQIGTQVTLDVVAYRYRSITINITDSTGAAYDVGTYFPSASLRMSVRSQNQTTTKWDAGPTATPTGFSISTSGSALSIILPEDATFFAALAAGADSTQLRWEVTGDYTGDAAMTQPIIRSSTLNLLRREVGT